MATYGEGPYGEGPYGEGGASARSYPLDQVTETVQARHISTLVRVPVDQVTESVEPSTLTALKEPNPFGMSVEVVGVAGVLPVDMSDATVEAGEPIPAGVTGTYWYTWTAPDVRAGLLQRFHTRGSNVDTTLRVYTGDDFGTLVLVTESDDYAGDAADVRFVPSAGQQYRIQVGVKTTPATGVQVTWLSGEPETYDAFETPLLLETAYGIEAFTTTNGTLQAGEPTPVGVTATSWLTWTATVEELVTFRVRGFGTESFSVAVYRGSTLGGLTAVTSATGAETVQVDWTPVLAETYLLQIGSIDDLRDYEIDWLVEPIPVAPVPLPMPPAPDDYPDPADPPLPRLHLRVQVYQEDGKTLITEVPRRLGVSGQEPLNEPGYGQVTVALDDEILSAYPDLLDFGHVVKFWLGDTCISGFVIKQRRTRLVDTGERVARVREVAGPTVHHWLKDFIVVHDGAPRPDSPDRRFYSWASKPGEWYDAADWQETVNQWSMQDPPSNKKKNKPKNWRARSAKWINITGSGGWRYFRRNWTAKENGLMVRLFATADEWWKLYLDGELVLEGDRREIGYTEFEKVDLVLGKGQHTFAALARSFASKKGDGNDSFLFAMCEVDLDGKIVLPPLLVSDNSWKGHAGNPAPGWNRAQVLRNVVKEAQARAVESATRLTFGFDGSTDSEGKVWPDVTFNQEVGIGTSALDLQAQLSEGNGFDVWVDPADLTLHAYRRRGTDWSASVTLEPGRNLLDWEVEETDEVQNSWLIQYDGGWTDYQAKGSQKDSGVRESYVSLGGVKEDKGAKNLVKRAAAGIARAQVRAGTGEIRKRPFGQPDGGLVGVEGAYPFLDFGVGDVVKAPNAAGRLVPTRVLALTFTEDVEGNLTFDPDVEEVRGV